MRTTSSLESFNSVLGRSCPKHPHIYRFIDYLKIHEYNVCLEMWRLIQKDPIQVPSGPRRKIDIERQNKIKECTDLLKNKKISIAQFLDALLEDVNLPRKGNIIL